MDEVRRDDGELCGFVVGVANGWESRTVFGAVLRVHETRQEAVEYLVHHGLAVLAEHWTYHSVPNGDGEIACIVEASPTGVTIVVDYYPTPGAPRFTLTPEQVRAGRLRFSD